VLLIRLVTFVLPPPDLRRVASYVRQRVSTGSISDESMRLLEASVVQYVKDMPGLWSVPAAESGLTLVRYLRAGVIEGR